jgi:hypothetical protein
VFALPTVEPLRQDDQPANRPPFARPSNLRAELRLVKDLAMNSSDLFSHPYEPEVVPDREASSEPVQAPAFSDRDDSTADKPPSS